MILRQKRVLSATDENGHPILTEEYVDRGPRITRNSFDGQMQHSWARKRFYESSPPTADALVSSWPTPVPNRRRRKVKKDA